MLWLNFMSKKYSKISDLVDNVFKQSFCYNLEVLTRQELLISKLILV